MSLLTDRLVTSEELEENVRRDYPEFRIADEDDRMSDILHFTREAQDTKSIKVDRQAMAEWFMGICSEHKHAPLEHRIDCDECICELPELLREDKAPWETD